MTRQGTESRGAEPSGTELKGTGLFFDARYIRVDHHDGISRFSAGLFTALNQLIDVTAIICDLRQLDKLPAGTKFIKLSAPTSAAEPLIALKLNKIGAKVVFSPMQTMGTLGRKFKVLLTVHDLIYYKHPTPPPAFSPIVRMLWRLYHLSYWPQRLLLNRADAIVAVSETTKKLITENRLTKRPVHVVHNAPESANVHAQLTVRMMPAISRKLVYMGSFMDYKNVELLVSNMSDLPEYELHLLSRISNDRKDQLQNLMRGNSNIVFHNGTTDEDYQNLLQEAFALVSASRDEGFGIPLVEAMSLGTPIIVSDIAIFREIGGSAAKYFDQENSKSFKDAVQSLASEATWKQSSKAAIEQSKLFSWESSAKELLKLIKQI
jgi:glycosyltransferase involved in cell wall biosynthesis